METTTAYRASIADIIFTHDDVDRLDVIEIEDIFVS